MMKTRTRRAFLGAAGTLLSAFAFAKVLPACSGGTELPPANKSKPAPTDGNEYVPGTTPKPTPSEVQPSDPGNPQWEARAKELEGENQGGVAYTAETPGPFAGKERSHVPSVTVQSDGVAILLVNHVMDSGASPDAGADAGLDAGKADAGKSDAGDAAVDSGVRPVHYITTIWAKDDKGRVVYLKEFVSTDPAPPFVAFQIPKGATSVRAYEHCNLHGVWASNDAKA